MNERRRRRRRDAAVSPETREASSRSCRGSRRWRGRSRPRCRTSLQKHGNTHRFICIYSSGQQCKSYGEPRTNNLLQHLCLNEDSFYQRKCFLWESRPQKKKELFFKAGNLFIHFVLTSGKFHFLMFYF